MSTQRDFERLADLIVSIKRMEERKKELTDRLLAEAPPKQIRTNQGLLVVATRSNWDPINNQLLIAKIGQDAFNRKATITAGKLKELGGETMIKDLVAAKILVPAPATNFFSLKS